ncbi:DUF3862 domain-containing protein [Bacillus sp. DX4.1]|uniref:DUF3862 domain-containing protein n=1 Tax=Bacillus sp. DX4.1 TaxID=3055867 RepID=UPI0025A03877|nr:DUF3862 domain-containing protein [Bacillus sp. DX4.1]MDM5188651.1 DUF3862 domain-containing protein [Bacillus sp. DX4.1]
MKNNKFLIVCCLGMSLLIGMTACDQKKEVKKQTATSSTVMEKKGTTPINIKLFSQINEGMSYNEVKELVGCEGDLLTEYGEKNAANYQQTFAWKGNAPQSFAEITFSKGKVRSKTQRGLAS